MIMLVSQWTKWDRSYILLLSIGPLTDVVVQSFRIKRIDLESAGAALTTVTEGIKHISI